MGPGHPVRLELKPFRVGPRKSPIPYVELCLQRRDVTLSLSCGLCPQLPVNEGM